MKPKFNTKWQNWNTDRYQLLQDNLQLLHQEHSDELVVTQAKLGRIRSVIQELRKEVIREGFENPSEEIWFLKTLLPKYHSLQYLYSQWLMFWSNMPVSTPRLVLQHYLAFYRQTDYFFQQHYPFYPYYRLSLTESDHLYFIRGQYPESTIYLPLADPAYSTEVSELFARFSAMETLRGWLLDYIRKLGAFPVMDTWQEPFSGRRLKWTGQAVNLVELIYGLYYTGQLNNGKASLADIACLMEDLFQFKIPRLYRAFYGLRYRKVSTTTQFLEDMHKAVADAIEQDLAYKHK